MPTYCVNNTVVVHSAMKYIYVYIVAAYFFRYSTCVKVRCIMNVGERVVVVVVESGERINDVKPILIPSLKPTRAFFRVYKGFYYTGRTTWI